MAELIVGKEFSGIKIEMLIKRLYPHLPMSFIYKILRKGKVRVNKRKVSNSHRVNEGDYIILHLPPEVLSESKDKDSSKSLYELVDSDIIFENEDFIAINKRAGFAVHGGEGHKEDVILGAIERYLKFDKSSLRFPPTPVHRLDIDTSGVLIFAKNYEFLRLFNELQRERKIYKEYVVLVAGHLEGKKKDISAPVIRRDRPKEMSESKEGKTTVFSIDTSTKFESEISVFTLLRAVIKTGLTHQIRSHLMQVGLPVVGDKLYGDSEINRWARKRLELKRQFLHSHRMRFEYKGEVYNLEAPLPDDLLKALNILEIDFLV